MSSSTQFGRDGGAPKSPFEPLLRLLQFFAVLLAFYRGYRAPSLWSLNYYQLSWADGFFRRGLLGMFLLPLGCARFDPHVVWVIQYLVLAGSLLVMFRWARRGAAAWVLCLFMLSDLGTQYFNEVGYPDQLLLLLTVACGVLLTRGRPLAAALLMAAAALIHEMAAFTVAPVVLVLWLRLPRERRYSWIKLFGPMALVLAALTAFSTAVPFSVLRAYYQAAMACGHPLGRVDFLLYYHEPLGQEFQFFYHGVELAGVVLPLMGTTALWIFSGGADPQASQAERWAIWLACCCPLLLGFIGADRNRWTMLVLVQLLLLLGFARSGESASGRPARGGLRRRIVFALPLVLVVLTLRIALFDGFVPRPLTLAGIAHFGSVLAGQWNTLPVR